MSISSIEKLDSARIKQEKIPFTMHHNYVLQNIKCTTALAIWCYLTSLPDDWKIHRTHLMDHFGIGRDKLFKALKFLHDNYLLEYSQARNADGVFGDSHISIKCGYDFEQYHKKLSTDSTAILKNRTTENPLYGKTAPTKEINKSFKKEDKKIERAARKKRVPLPVDFQPNAEATALASQKGLDVIRVLYKFRAHAKSEGWLKEDWHEAFMKWLIDERTLGNIIDVSQVKMINRNQTEPRSTVAWFNNNH